jgi:hypothetical protein
MDDLRDSLIVILLIAVLTSYQTASILNARTYQLSENTIVTSLIAGCELWDIFPPSQPARTVVLACPGVDLVRLWPLPMQQPWFEDGCEIRQYESLRRTANLFGGGIVSVYFFIGSLNGMCQ